MTPPRVTVGVVLSAAIVGAFSLARQRPIVPPPPSAPAAWSVASHDSARTGHSLSFSAALPLTLLWGPRPLLPIVRSPVVDGEGNIYLSRLDGALLSLSSNGDTRWCAALQAVADASCVAPLPLSGGRVPLPAAPSMLAGNDGHIYVIDGLGRLAVFDSTSPTPQWVGTMRPAPLADIGLSVSLDGRVLYGVAARRGTPRCAIVAYTRHGGQVAEWHISWLKGRVLSPVTVAPDGTLLLTTVLADGTSVLHRVSARGGLLWSRRLGVGVPSACAVAGGVADWSAWVALGRTNNAPVLLIDERGTTVWRWESGDALWVREQAFALARPRRRTSIVYVDGVRGVYALDPIRRRGRMFFRTGGAAASGAARGAASDPAGPPTTDYRGTVYLSTERGAVYDLWPSGRVRWSYRTGRNAKGPLVLDPHGSVIVLDHDVITSTMIEELGAGGMPLARGTTTATVLPCAAADCPTPAATASPDAHAPALGG